MIETTYIDVFISAEAESWNGIDPTRRGRRIIRKSKSGHVLFLQSSLKGVILDFGQNRPLLENLQILNR